MFDLKTLLTRLHQCVGDATCVSDFDVLCLRYAPHLVDKDGRELLKLECVGGRYLLRVADPLVDFAMQPYDLGACSVNGDNVTYEVLECDELEAAKRWFLAAISDLAAYIDRQDLDAIEVTLEDVAYVLSDDMDDMEAEVKKLTKDWQSNRGCREAIKKCQVGKKRGHRQLYCLASLLEVLASNGEIDLSQRRQIVNRIVDAGKL